MTAAAEADPRNHGRRRGEEERARQEKSAELWESMFTAAAVDEHRATSARLRAAHTGLFPGMSPEDHGAAVADRDVTIGADYGGRPLERNGHLRESIGPTPHRVYRSQLAERPGFQRDADRPILRHLRGEQ